MKKVELLEIRLEDLDNVPPSVGTEERIDDSEFVACLGDLVTANVARDVCGAQQEAGVVLAGRIELRSDVRGVAQDPDLVARPHCQALPVHV
jgi:hypothetical protein